MTNLPRPSGKEMVRFLVRQGFALVRIRGSHHFLESEGKRTTVPVHGSRRLKIGTLAQHFARHRHVADGIYITVAGVTGRCMGAVFSENQRSHATS